MTELVRICAKAQVAADRALPVRLAGYEPLAVCNVDGTFHVVADTCSHGLANLSEGEVADGQIICPFHGGAFDVRTGKATEAPCTIPIAVYAVVERGDELFMEARA